jgi:hypothetical protein
MAKRWIKGAIRHPGALRAKARRAGMGTMAYARAHRHAKGATGRQSRLALTLHRLPRPSRAARRRGARKAARTRAHRRR